ncbi:MAG: 6-phosphogluconolactonase [Salinivirgaceae bacterium]|jgi:6-phosphogluconolactonase|nr:6-phosphogluconolactonase [Salinivirgaceae bacterium]
MNYKIFSNKAETAKALAEDLYQLISKTDKDKITIAISGGSTPFVMFDIWAKRYSQKIDWNKLHFFWVDERCVDPLDDESNYKNTKQVLFDKVNIPGENIHRVRGERDPNQEALLYAKEIGKHVVVTNSWPQFDILLLGMGDDGHTASIFPPQIDLMESEKTVSVAQNPYSGQERITLTGRVINNASNVYFLVTGQSKAEKVTAIFNKIGNYRKYPAAHIKTESGNLTWYLDQEAGSFLE